MPVGGPKQAGPGREGPGLEWRGGDCESQRLRCEREERRGEERTHLRERVLVGHVIDQNAGVAVAVVDRAERVEPAIKSIVQPSSIDRVLNRHNH